MKLISCTLLGLSLFISGYLKAQDNNQWNGKKCSVVLTYDDALNVHLDNVIPQLDSAGLKATFYLIGESPVVTKRIAEWRKIAYNGNELGNHSLRHPCDGRMPGRTWITAENDLSKYTVNRAVKEIEINNTLLQAIDGKTERTFAFPCEDKLIDSVNFYNSVKQSFVGARGIQDGMQSIKNIDVNNIYCYAINGQPADYMINLVKKAMDTNTLLVFLFHGVGGEHNLNVSLDAHRQLIAFLKQNKNQIWIAPMVEVAKYITAKQTFNK